MFLWLLVSAVLEIVLQDIGPHSKMATCFVLSAFDGAVFEKIVALKDIGRHAEFVT